MNQCACEHAVYRLTNSRLFSVYIPRNQDVVLQRKFNFLLRRVNFSTSLGAVVAQRVSRARGSPDKHTQRAAVVVSVFAHAYSLAPPREPMSSGALGPRRACSSAARDFPSKRRTGSPTERAYARFLVNTAALSGGSVNIDAAGGIIYLATLPPLSLQ